MQKTSVNKRKNDGVAACSQVQNWPTVSLGQQGYPETEKSLGSYCAVALINALKPEKFQIRVLGLID